MPGEPIVGTAAIAIALAPVKLYQARAGMVAVLLRFPGAAVGGGVFLCWRPGAILTSMRRGSTSGVADMTFYLLAFLIGVIAGLRAMTAPAAVSWAAALGWIHLDGTWLAFLGYAYTPYVFTVLAIVELITDQLPSTPSRKVPQQFGARIVSGALCGTALGIAGGGWIAGLAAGILGAIVGTLGGAEARGRLVKAIGGWDLPIALIEDAVAILGALAIIWAAR